MTTPLRAPDTIWGDDDIDDEADEYRIWLETQDEASDDGRGNGEDE